ncbi:MAG: glycosyltransferase [Desulfomicrobium sp.]
MVQLNSRQFKPNISVIMPVYNADRFLRQAVESILFQSFSNFEFIIIDDCSTDQTCYILNDYKKKDDRIKIFKNNQNLGVAKSLNFALNLATANYVARMDADDISEPQRLEEQYNFMVRNPSVTILGSALCCIDENENVISKRQFPINSNDITNSLLTSFPIAHPTVMMVRDRIVSAGGYRADFNYAEDYELWLRAVALGYEIRNLEAQLLRYRVAVKGVTQTKADLQFLLCETARIFFLNNILLDKALFSPETGISELIQRAQHYMSSEAFVDLERISKSVHKKNNYFFKYFCNPLKFLFHKLGGLN